MACPCVQHSILAGLWNSYRSYLLCYACQEATGSWLRMPMYRRARHNSCVPHPTRRTTQAVPCKCGHQPEPDRCRRPCTWQLRCRLHWEAGSCGTVRAPLGPSRSTRAFCAWRSWRAARQLPAPWRASAAWHKQVRMAHERRSMRGRQHPRGQVIALPVVVQAVPAPQQAPLSLQQPAAAVSATTMQSSTASGEVGQVAAGFTGDRSVQA